jgi:hypothetical protein
MRDTKELYLILEVVLIEQDLINKSQSDLIARRGRKSGRWGRHILDLCQYVLGKMEREGVDNEHIKYLLESIIDYVKNGKRV